MSSQRVFGLLFSGLMVCTAFTITVARAEEKIDLAKLPAAAQKKIDFVKEIQPIFRRTCYSCHGAEKQEGGLRLDSKKRAFEGGDNGKVLVPGKSDHSSLLAMIAGIDENSGIMPPEGEGTPLTKQQIGLVRAWIEQGADWPAAADTALAAVDHWSFKPIRKVTPPTVKNPQWVRNGIDAFVLARLEKEKIQPSPEADRATLMRRLYLDLLGLPPTPAEAEAFLSDTRPDAYEQLVERVLASPHLGERWGRHWLDLARYADSDGYEKDRPRPHAWRYRQWVVDAINADMPYDRFTIQQVAGDMLPGATIEQKVASGFHRNTLHNTEGGTDKEEDRVKKTVDRINTVSTVWLGLTVGCAQCHSHKYDPISQREFYSMYALFNSINEADIDAPLPRNVKRELEIKQTNQRRRAELQKAVDTYLKTKLPAAQTAWEKTVGPSGSVWQPLTLTTTASKHQATFETLKDQSILVKGKNVASDVYTISASSNLPEITAIRLEALPDKSLVAGGPGRADNGNFVLSTFSIQVTQPNGKPVTVALAAARADYSQKGWEVPLAINDNPQDGWAVGAEFGKRHVAVFELKQPLKLAAGAKLTIVLDQTYKDNAHNLGHFRLSVTNSKPPIGLEGLPAAIAKILATEPAKRNKAQQEQLSAYYQPHNTELAKLKKAVVGFDKQAPKGSGVKAQSIVELAAPRQANIHIRGNFLDKGDPVQPSTPEFLPPLKSRGKTPDRLDFANWLVDSSNPLTARVTVNRLWQRIFGRGIALSSDDFGTQGSPPTHADLLDWLAGELPRGDWSIKNALRLIATSSTYRQSSAVRSELDQIDPENSLLARQIRRRVEAEVIRDLALAASGLLDPRTGGPAVRPPQPSEYSKLTYANSARWAESKGGDKYRRGLYTFFQRTSPYPMLMTFDSPDSNACIARRSMSNTPLQALTLWNDRVFFEAAQSLGRRIVRDAPAGKDAAQSIRSRAGYSFLICMGRHPKPAELDAVIELYRDQISLTKADEKAAASIVGTSPMPTDTNKAELAAWVIVGRSLMNLDEFITRE